MHAPEFALLQDFLGLGARRAPAPSPVEHAPGRAYPEAARTEADPRGVPHFAAFFRLAARAAPFVLLLGLVACKGHPEPARPPSPPSVDEQGSDFLADAVLACIRECAPRDPRWGAWEVAGVRHLYCAGCQPLPNLGTSPKVKRVRPKVSSKPATERGAVDPGQLLKRAPQGEPGAVAVEDSGRAGLSFAGGPTP